MNRQIFTWNRSSSQLRREERWLDFLCLGGLFLAALILFTINLGSLPLLDGHETTIAQVAQEIWQAPVASQRWLFPTLSGKPYFEQSSLIPGLIALSYSLGGLHEWTTRLPVALLCAGSVPIFYSLTREIFPNRLAALFSALIYLTLFPVARQGRFALSDGALLSFSILLVWCVLRSRRDLRWSVGVGWSFSLLGLTQGTIGLVLLGIVLTFIAWDTPRLFTSIYFWFGLLLGCFPLAAWLSFQLFHYHQLYVAAIFGELRQHIPNWRQLPWYYFLDILKYSWPWLLFSLYGFDLAQKELNYSWAKLVLVWVLIYLIVVPLLPTQHPGWILPFYPSLAIAGGAALADVWNYPSNRPYPHSWVTVLGILALVMQIASLYYYFEMTFAGNHNITRSLLIAIISAAFTLEVSAILLARRSRQFINVLFWGMYISLLLFLSSPHSI
jgi:4-amino-4-deoxy-L-arabinose transferase-like glycosyltransferase